MSNIIWHFTGLLRLWSQWARQTNNSEPGATT
jgi:hypothetical protein